MTPFHSFTADPDAFVTCCITGDLIPRAVAVFDAWGEAYASQRVLDDARDEAEAEAADHTMYAGWR